MSRWPIHSCSVRIGTLAATIAVPNVWRRPCRPDRRWGEAVDVEPSVSVLKSRMSARDDGQRVSLRFWDALGTRLLFVSGDQPGNRHVCGDFVEATTGIEPV